MKRTLVTIAVAIFALSAATASQAPARRVAITIDDGPVVNEMTDLGRFQRITNGLIGSFRHEKVPVTMFVNERSLNVPGQRDSRAAVLDQWLDAGFDLGNHTYSHPSVNSVPLAQFQDEVIKGEVITREVLRKRDRDLVWFRYPYLHSGTTAETHDGIVSFLEARKYKVAHITVDYADYTFAGAYSRELQRGNTEASDRILEAYVAQVDVGFEYAEKASMEVYGREIAQILLIHCNELNSVAVGATIERMRKRGYQFISLDEAVQDEAYQRADTFTGPGGSWLSRTASSMGKRITAAQPRVPQWIAELGR